MAEVSKGPLSTMVLAGGREEGGRSAAGGLGRLPRAAAVGARSRPVLPLTPLPFPAVRRASSLSRCRVPLESSTLPSHSLLFPPSSAPLPRLPPSPGFLPSLLSSDLNLVPSPFLPQPARACGAAAGGKASGAPRVLPAPLRAGPTPRPRWRGGQPQKGGRAAAGSGHRPPARGHRGEGERGRDLTASRPALAAVAGGCGAAEVSGAPGSFLPSRGGPCAQSRVLPSVFFRESRAGGVTSLEFIFLFPSCCPVQRIFSFGARQGCETRAAFLGSSDVQRESQREKRGLAAGFTSSSRYCPHVCVTNPSQQELLSPLFTEHTNYTKEMFQCTPRTPASLGARERPQLVIFHKMLKTPSKQKLSWSSQCS